MRHCEDCGIRMPAFRARYRHPETGKLVCGGCHPNKPGSPGRPVGHHGSKAQPATLSCASCTAPMGDAGLIRQAGLLVCADGCKTAATWFENNGGESFDIEHEDVGQAVVSMEIGRDGTHTGRWEYDAFRYDDLPTRYEGITDSLEQAKSVCQEYLSGGQMRLAVRKTAEQVEVEVAGLALQAADTGRILMLQRSYSDKGDPARGTFEFPGGHVEDDEAPVTAATREWMEEVGTGCPQGDITGSWRSPNGIYQGFVMRVESEVDVPVNLGTREVANPDDPDGDDIETVVWLRPEDVPEMPALRTECKDTDWSLFEETAMQATAARTARTSVPPHEFVGMGPAHQICDVCDMVKNHIVHTTWTAQQASPTEHTWSARLRKQAHDSGDGATIYHCPFCGAGQTVARSDGTVECGFCKTYFTVQVQPEHSAMPQTDPLTGQPLNMSGMPGDPTGHQAPSPTPTQTAAPAGVGGFAPAGTGGTEGFAPAGQGPVEQFAPAGSGGGARAASLQVTAWDNDEWDEQHDPQGDPCTRCGGDGEIDGPCTACEGTGQKTGSRKTSDAADPSGLTVKKEGEEYVLRSANGREVARSKDRKLLEDYRLQRDSSKTAMYLTPDQVALPEPSYLASLAIRFADDREAVLQQVRRERAAR